MKKSLVMLERKSASETDDPLMLGLKILQHTIARNCVMIRAVQWVHRKAAVQLHYKVAGLTGIVHPTKAAIQTHRRLPSHDQCEALIQDTKKAERDHQFSLFQI